MKALALILMTVSLAFAGEQPKIFIAPFPGGFDAAIAGAITKKRIPVVLVTKKDGADYVLQGTAQNKKASGATTVMTGILLGLPVTGHSQASVELVDKKGHIVWAYTVRKMNSWTYTSDQSAAEAIAKHLRKYLTKERGRR
ncbi:MAG TPA: hypothetical protein VMX16_07925 [Terriglobia bacterium]|nr:hypothetical protein [Terriglobia bacterium]